MGYERLWVDRGMPGYGSFDCKKKLTKAILQECQSILSELGRNGRNVHRDICSRFHSTFGPVIYNTIIKAFAFDKLPTRQPLAFCHETFLPHIKKCFAECSNVDIQSMITRFGVKSDSHRNPLIYRYVLEPSKEKIQSTDAAVLLSKIFLHEEAFCRGLAEI